MCAGPSSARPRGPRSCLQNTGSYYTSVSLRLKVGVVGFGRGRYGSVVGRGAASCSLMPSVAQGNLKTLHRCLIYVNASVQLRQDAGACGQRT